MKVTRVQQKACGFTVAEMMVAIGVLGLLGIVFFDVLRAGIILFAENAAVNIAHEEARKGINRLTRDIHASVSMPQLCDLDTTTNPITLVPSTTLSPISGVAVGPMYAAVTFQNVANGPNYVWNDPAGGNKIMIKDNYNVTAGQHLLIPFWGALYEQDIYKATAGGASNHSNIFIQNDYQTGIKPRDSNSNLYAITYYTDRVAYVVMNGTFYKDPTNGIYTPDTRKSANFVWATPAMINGGGKLYSYMNGELHQFKQRYNGTSYYWQDVATVARNLTSAMPFYSPVNPNGGFNTRYVGVKITATDAKVTNRNFVAVNSLIDTTIDYRTAIALTQ